MKRTLFYRFFLMALVIVRKTTCVLNISNKKSQKIIDIQAIIDKMRMNIATFQIPDPPLDDVQKHLNVYSKAEVALESGSGGIKERDLFEVDIDTDMDNLRIYVQILMNKNRPEAKEIAEKANMKWYQQTPRKKQVFNAKHGIISGTVDLVAGGVKNGSHEWAMSLNNKYWDALPGTKPAKTQVVNLTFLTKVWFRHRSLTSKGYTEWGYIEPITIL